MNAIRNADVKRFAVTSLVVAILAGAFYSWVVRQFWGIYVISNPIANWLRELIPPRDHTLLHPLAVYTHDVVLNILLAAPFAAVLILFSHQRRWLSLVAAVFGSIVVGYWGTEWGSYFSMASSAAFWIGIGMAVLPLPISFLVIGAAHRRWNHA